MRPKQVSFRKQNSHILYQPLTPAKQLGFSSFLSTSDKQLQVATDPVLHLVSSGTPGVESPRQLEPCTSLGTSSRTSVLLHALVHRNFPQHFKHQAITWQIRHVCSSQSSGRPIALLALILSTFLNTGSLHFAAATANFPEIGLLFRNAVVIAFTDVTASSKLLCNDCSPPPSPSSTQARGLRGTRNDS